MHRSVVPCSQVAHPLLAPREPDWALKKAGVGVADELAREELAKQAAAPPV